MLKLKRRHVSKSKYSKREISAARFIPYKYHWDKETIVTKNDELLQVIKIEGFPFETADDMDVDMKKMVRNSFLKSLADGTFAMYFHTIRRRQSAYPGGQQPPGFASYVDNLWKQKHHSKESYVNELYVTVVRKVDTKGAAKIENAFKAIERSADANSADEDLREMQKELKEAVYRMLATFRDYGARVLTVVDTPHGPHSEPIEFLGRLVNCCDYYPMLVPTMEISKYIPVNRLYFGPRAMEVRGPSNKKYGAMVSIKEYAPHTAAGLFDSFLQLPFEFIITQSFEFVNRQTNLGDMQRQQNKMLQAEDKALSQVAEISDALDMAMSGHVAFGTHHMTVLVLDDSLAGIEDNVSMAIAEMVNVGINPVREKLVMEQCFWAQLPGNFDFIGRPSKVNTLNLAGFCSMHNYPVGMIDGNHWGDAVSVFDTTSGTPYYFNFHLRDVGHTTVIGPTGAGKTVLMNFLAAQSQKYNCRMFMFDKDRGAEIFVRAMAGKYSVIDPGTKCRFNPLHLPDTMENRNFLAEWLKTMVTIHDEPFTAHDMDKVQEAVRVNYKLAKKDRILRNIAPVFGLEGPGTLAGRLRMWHGDGQYAGLFDNEDDIIDFSQGNIFGFEMGEVLADKISLMPTLLYIFHRIHLSLDGTPTMIYLDEAWALIDNKVFVQKIKDWLKTLRKLNGMVVFATQSVEDATQSDISATLIQQTSTHIFLPNPKATEDYRSQFMISEREFNLIKNTDMGTRYFLLKHGKDIVVARIDLTGMEDVIHVLSGRAETVALLDKIRAQVGDDPDDWLPIFRRKVLSGNVSAGAKNVKSGARVT
ncbi:MAG: VirB4 family type IV secretion/conjugal transfer ATPase [Rickettsiales bacterium]|nr:VirB4 family type IV secretion/conjugal transfer ATPase [Rickettsiales bacterium]